MRFLYLCTLAYTAYADCRNIADLTPVAKEHVVDIQFQIAAENQFDGIENGRLLVTPNVDLAAALDHASINTDYLDNGHYKHWVKTWASFTKLDLSLSGIENLFESITPQCSFENTVQYFDVDTDNCLGYRDTTPPCDFSGIEGCTNLYDIDVTYTMCFMRNNQTDNCVPFDDMPDFWNRSTQTTIWTDEYICVRNADNSKEIQLEYFEPSVYIMRKDSALDYGSFISVPPIETREFVASFCTEDLDEEGQAALLAATQAALAIILGIDPGNLIPSFDNETLGAICGEGERRRLQDGLNHGPYSTGEWTDMVPCAEVGSDGTYTDCEVVDAECHVPETCSGDECDCACEVAPADGGISCTVWGLDDTDHCKSTCDEDGNQIDAPTPAPSPAPSPPPTDAPTPPPTDAPTPPPTFAPTPPTPAPTPPTKSPTKSPTLDPTLPPVHSHVPHDHVPHDHNPHSHDPHQHSPHSHDPPSPPPVKRETTTTWLGRITDVKTQGNIDKTSEIDDDEFSKLVADNGFENEGASFKIVPKVPDAHVNLDAPAFELSYWEMVAFIYGIYYALFLLLEAQLTFSNDYHTLRSINGRSRYHYLENYRIVQDRNRSPENELTIFKNSCGRRR